MIKRIELADKPQYLKIETGHDFFELFKKIEREFETCFFLESLGEESYDSRYSVIGFDPDSIVRAQGKTLWVDNVAHANHNPYELLRTMVPQTILSRNYAGGLVGYIAYDAMNYFEPSLGLKEHPDFDRFCFGVYKDGLILDKMTGKISYFFYNRNRSALIQEILKKPLIAETDYSLKVAFLGRHRSREEHRAQVESALEEIRAGNTFQCQIGFRVNFGLDGNPFAIYAGLRKINPSPHMFYIKFGQTKIIGASPELIFRLRQGEMETFPLAGTTKRGSSPEEDKTLARLLLEDPKEIAEHNMLVDLHRNDLGRVARFGTVKVRRLMDIKRFSHVQHISSEVVGIIRNGEDMFSGLAASFPAGTLSGAPKIESMKIIERLEDDPRGPYGGAVGHFGFNGDCTFAIPIRSLFISGSKAFGRASGGIVYDSNPEDEYVEIERKLAAVENTLRSL